MLKAEILCVGTELLMGQVVNTNAAHIAKKLSEIGIGVLYSSVVGDNAKRLKEAVETALSRCDILVTTGGLGPTDDDLTKETVCEAMGKKLFFHADSLERIKRYYKIKEALGNRENLMSKKNEKQAYLPEGCIVLENDNGTAPGCIIEDNGKIAVLLPGPPGEMTKMFEKALVHLKKKSSVVMKTRVLRVFGIGESNASEMLDDIIKNQSNPTIAPYAKEGEVTFRITASAESENEAARLCDEMAEKVYSVLGECIYAEGDDNSMAEVVVKALKEKGLTLASCESCTGGLIGQMITGIPGSSEVYKYGFITYSNEAKEKLVGVKKETLDEFSAVSSEAAKEMAQGARERAGSDIAVSVTGYAGPSGRELGLVFVGVCDKSGVEAYRFLHMGDRERIRKKSALCALDIVNKRLKNL